MHSQNLPPLTSEGCCPLFRGLTLLFPFLVCASFLLSKTYSGYTLNPVHVRRYAWECQTPEGGWGLDAVLRDNSWKLRGIINGIDYSEWSPQARIWTLPSKPGERIAYLSGNSVSGICAISGRPCNRLHETLQTLCRACENP